MHEIGKIAQYIEHTLLKPDATEMQIRKLCEEAMEHQFATVCVNPCWVKSSKKSANAHSSGKALVNPRLFLWQKCNNLLI